MPYRKCGKIFVTISLVRRDLKKYGALLFPFLPFPPSPPLLRLYSLISLSHLRSNLPSLFRFSSFPCPHSSSSFSHLFSFFLPSLSLYLPSFLSPLLSFALSPPSLSQMGEILLFIVSSAIYYLLKSYISIYEGSFPIYPSQPFPSPLIFSSPLLYSSLLLYYSHPMFAYSPFHPFTFLLTL